MNREACYTALFALFQTLEKAGVVKVCDRRARLLDEMEPTSLPALFMTVANQKVEQAEGAPIKRTLAATVYLYAANNDRHTSAGIVLNNLLDAVEQALKPSPGDPAQNLGGAVRHAWIEGTVEVFEGPQGERAAAILPINMLVP